MNLTESLKYAKLETYSEYALSSLLEDFSINVSIDTQLFNDNKGNELVKEYMIHEFSVGDHCGGLYAYTYNGKVFATMETTHEDSLNYSITCHEIFNEVVAFAMTCVRTQDTVKQTDDTSLSEIPLIQLFESTYNVTGQHLLYVEDDGKFTHIEKYWQDPAELSLDGARNYNDMYSYKYFEIITNGIQRRVNYKRIVSVIGNNQVLADLLVNTMNMNDDMFKTVWHYNNIMDLNN